MDVRLDVLETHSECTDASICGAGEWYQVSIENLTVLRDGTQEDESRIDDFR